MLYSFGFSPDLNFSSDSNMFLYFRLALFWVWFVYSLFNGSSYRGLLYGIFVEDLPVFALQDDRVVEVVGEPTSVHKSLELIASHLRKFLVDRSIIPVFESQVSLRFPLTLFLN